MQSILKQTAQSRTAGGCIWQCGRRAKWVAGERTQDACSKPRRGRRGAHGNTCQRPALGRAASRTRDARRPTGAQRSRCSSREIFPLASVCDETRRDETRQGEGEAARVAKAATLWAISRGRSRSGGEGSWRRQPCGQRAPGRLSSLLRHALLESACSG